MPQPGKQPSPPTQTLESFQDTLDEVRSETGVDLADDVIARLTGEFAVALLPDPAGLLGNDTVPLGLVVVAQVEQPEELKASLDSLFKTLEGEGLTLGEDQIGGTTFALLQDQNGKGTIGYGIKGDLLIIGSSPRMLQAAVQGGDRTLSDNEIFRAAVKPLPDRATGYLFVDVDEAVRLIYEALGPAEKADFDENIRSYLEPFRAISAGVGADGQRGHCPGNAVPVLTARVETTKESLNIHGTQTGRSDRRGVISFGLGGHNTTLMVRACHE